MPLQPAMHDGNCHSEPGAAPCLPPPRNCRCHIVAPGPLHSLDGCARGLRCKKSMEKQGDARERIMERGRHEGLGVGAPDGGSTGENATGGRFTGGAAEAPGHRLNEGKGE